MATILVAEPDAALRRLLAGWLAPRGHTTLEVGTATAAHATLQHRHVDLLIAAARLPDATAVDLLSEWQASQGSRPAVLLGTPDDRPAARTWIESGRARWFEPPLRPARLLQAVERLLSGRQEVSWP